MFELRAFQQRYERLSELAGVFKAAKVAEQRMAS